jgi:hypothetical protein
MRQLLLVLEGRYRMKGAAGVRKEAENEKVAAGFRGEI